MKTTNTYLMLGLLLFLTTTLSASDEWRKRGLRLDDDEEKVVDAFRIEDLTYVYFRDGFPNGDDAPKGLAKLIPVSQAEAHGQPGPFDSKLFKKFTGIVHGTKTVEVAAVRFGNDSFFWRATYDLSPEGTFYFVAPFQFIGYVNYDGAEIEPKRFICSRYYPHGYFIFSSNQMTIFSVMSFDDLRTQVDPATFIHGDKAQHLAQEAIDSLTARIEAEANGADKEQLDDDSETPAQPTAKRIQFRYRSQMIEKIPVDFKDSQTIQAWAWRVEFINSETPQKDIMTARPLNVWVTRDGIVSRLSVDSWEGKPCRATP